MQKLTSIYSNTLSVAVSLILAASLAAAQSDTPAETAEESTTEEVPGLTDGLSLGEEISDEPQVGQRYIGQTFGDWNLSCVKAESGDDPCEMSQLLEDAESNPVSQFSLIRLLDNPQAAAGATVIVPLETALQAQLTMKIDDNPAKRYPFSHCGAVGCYAQFGLTPEEVEALKKGNAATLTIVPILSQNQRVDVSLSLTGFTAAYGAVSVVEP